VRKTQKFEGFEVVHRPGVTRSPAKDGSSLYRRLAVALQQWLLFLRYLAIMCFAS
jgi:hypothetical protein